MEFTSDMECKKCKSHLTYIRLKTNQRRCRQCGYEETLDDDKKKGDKKE